MAFSYGFYNSLNGDRKYNAEQFSVLISCLITDGVLDNWGSMMMARPGNSGLSIFLGSGRAWFNDTWNENDSDIPFDLEFADPLLSRIDTLVLEVDKTVGIRANRVFIAKGTPATNAVPVTLLNGPDIFQHALAYITVEPNAQEITADKIQILVGTESCPFITSILEQASIEELFAGWEYQFDTWFEELQTKLSGDVAANLQYQIELLQTEKVNVSDKASIDDISNGTSDKWVDSKNLGDAFPGIKTGDIVLSYRNLNDIGYQQMDGRNINITEISGDISDRLNSNLSVPEIFGTYDEYSTYPGTAYTMRVLNNKMLFFGDNGLNIYMYDLLTDTFQKITDISKSSVINACLNAFIETSGDYFYVICPISNYVYGIWEIDQNCSVRSIGSIDSGVSGSTTIKHTPNHLYKRSNGDILFFTSSGTTVVGTTSYKIQVGIISNRLFSTNTIKSSLSGNSNYLFNTTPVNWDSCNGGSINVIERGETIVWFYGNSSTAYRLNIATSIDNGKTWSLDYIVLNRNPGSSYDNGRLAYALPLSDDEIFLGYMYGSSNSTGICCYKAKWNYVTNRLSEIVDVFMKNAENGGMKPSDVLWGCEIIPFGANGQYMFGLMRRYENKLFVSKINGPGVSRAIIDLNTGIAKEIGIGDAPNTLGGKPYIYVYQSIDKKILVVMDDVNYKSEDVKKYDSEIIKKQTLSIGLRIMMYYLDTDDFVPRIFTVFTDDFKPSTNDLIIQHSATEDEDFIYILHFGRLYKLSKHERRTDVIPYGWIKTS